MKITDEKFSFINTVNDVFSNLKVRKRIEIFNKIGLLDERYYNYFGINYTDEKIITIKFYFSYRTPQKSIFVTKNLLPMDIKDFIQEHWVLFEDNLDFNEGVTLGFKVQLDKKEFDISDYVHFRSLNFNRPLRLRTLNVEKDNREGVSIEWDGAQKLKKRNYFYFSTSKNKNNLLVFFRLDFTDKDIDIIEYTESEKEQKVILIIPERNTVEKYIRLKNNKKLNQLCQYLSEEKELFPFAPGERFNKNVSAIHFFERHVSDVPKDPNSVNKFLSI